MKRLRKKHNVRYFMCGEYGETTDRPHFHAILFGLQLNDLQLHADNGGNRLYTSKEFDDYWQHGYSTLGEVNFQTASYVASYCVKKITGDDATEHYERLDTETGELYTLQPEYARMSLKPGIGKTWIEKYINDVYNYDHVVINGKAQKAPRYYDKYLQTQDPAKLEKHKTERTKKAQLTKGENTPQKLTAREKITHAKYKQKQRTLQ
jgi:hypothetical protein